MKLHAKLPQEDAGATLMRFVEVLGQRYTETFIIGGNPLHVVESLKDLDSRLHPSPGWTVRTVVLAHDVVLAPDDGAAEITQDELGNTYHRVGGALRNDTP